MEYFDPINNKSDFERIIKNLYSWTRFVKTEDLIFKMVQQENISTEITKMQDCKNAIDNLIAQWDACQTEQEREVLVCSIESPTI